MKNSHLQPTLTNLRYSFYKPKVWRTLSWVDCGIFWYKNFPQKKYQTSCFPQMLLPNNLCHLELYKSSMPIIRPVRISYLFLFFNIFFLEIWGFWGLISRCCRYVLYFSNGCLEQRCPTMHSTTVQLWFLLRKCPETAPWRGISEKFIVMLLGGSNGS